MAHLITMPKFGLTMTEGTIAYWYKEIGEQVEQGEPLFEVETEKIANEVESPATGILRHIFVAVGESAEVGARLAIIADEGEDISGLLADVPQTATDSGQAADEHASTEAGAAEKVSSSDSPQRGESAIVSAASSDVRATPYARKRAREQGIPLQSLHGTGPQGIVVARDVAASAGKQASLPAGEAAKAAIDDRESEVMRGMRKAIAERMTASWQQIPHVTLTREIDVTLLLAAMARLAPDAERLGVRIGLTPLLIKLTAAALRRHPELHAWCDGQTIIRHQEVHMGVAVSVPGGLLVPVIRQADHKSLSAIARELVELRSRAHEQRLTAAEIQGGTFTLSNLGMMGVDGFTPLLNPPQTGILGVGRVVEKPRFLGDQLVKRSVAVFSLSFDHRALDGAEAAAFLQTLDRYIQEPLHLLL